MPPAGSLCHGRTAEIDRGANRAAPRNAPTVLNAALYFKQHWDGGFATVEEQAKRSLLGPAFANPDFPTAMARLKAIPGYPEMFRAAFPGEPDPVSEDNWGKAIGAFERTLVSPSRFDEYLGGKADALTADERKGLRTFIDTGCSQCHSGRGVGGHRFEKFGVAADYWKATGSKPIDNGRFGVTNNPADRYKFKVASLRNVAMTPPYFHDGSVDLLPRAVQIMAKVQLDTDLSEPEVIQIVAFLGSLTGTIPEEFNRAPSLPPGGFKPLPSGQTHTRTTPPDRRPGGLAREAMNAPDETSIYKTVFLQFCSNSQKDGLPEPWRCGLWDLLRTTVRTENK